MKRAIINFTSNFDYEEFKNYADSEEISMSKAILQLAKNSLDDLTDKKLGDLAIKRMENASNYIESEKFWNKVNDL